MAHARAAVAAPGGDDPAVAQPSVRIVSKRQWHARGAPMVVDISRDGVTGEVDLALLDAAGTEVASVTVRELSVDLLTVLPAIATMERAAYLQAVVQGDAVGSPLVIEPLRTPRRVRTRELTTPEGTVRMDIIGWDAEALPSATEEDRAAMAAKVALEEVVTAGFRLYLEEDVLLSTDRGDMRIAFAHDQAPATGHNMRRLAREGFYDGLVFHRIVAIGRDGNPFVVQGGDPAGTGDGTPGYAITLEESDLPFDFGVLGMARADEPHSVGCQFFIALSREGTARLDGKYSAFAYCTEGEPAIRALETSVIEDPVTQRPAIPPRILQATVVPAPPRAPGKNRFDTRVERSDSGGSGEQR
ncbi:MAG: peptidylprolyl isomerase [Planctomycetota bacterium]|nr:peptidylprolyl isomerase [Planctomycetota bacterium]